jgi:class 3 adenylate cyclase
MITKDQREQDRAIAERVTKPLPWRWWTSNSHRRLKSDAVPGEVAFGTKLRDGCDDIVIDERDMAHLENAANRLPAYIDALDEMERRIERIADEADAYESGTVSLQGTEEHDPRAVAALHRLVARVLRTAVQHLRGEP